MVESSSSLTPGREANDCLNRREEFVRARSRMKAANQEELLTVAWQAKDLGVCVSLGIGGKQKQKQNTTFP